MKDADDRALTAVELAQVRDLETRWGADIKRALDNGLDPDVLVSGLVGYVATYAFRRGWTEEQVSQVVRFVREFLARSNQ